jgi:hypothetical protein
MVLSGLVVADRDRNDDCVHRNPPLSLVVTDSISAAREVVRGGVVSVG